MAGLSQKKSTGQRTEAFCQKKGLELNTVHVSAGVFPDAILHFITPKNAPAPTKNRPGDAHRGGAGRTVFYCHGGGYHNPIIENAQVPFALDMASASKAHRLVILECSLTPGLAYPCQLVQAVAALQYVLKEKRVLASDIVLAGDSAGAHLVLGLLAHVVSPAPFAPGIDFEKREPFCAAVLVSPWVSMRGEEASISANERDDYLNKKRLVEFVDHLGADFGDVWFSPWEAPGAQAVWDVVFPPKNALVTTTRKPMLTCSNVLVTVGTSEVLLDSCLDFAKRFVKCESVYIGTEADAELVKRRETKDTTTSAILAVVSGEVHVQPGLDNAVGHKDGLTTMAVRGFLEGV